MEFGMFHEFQRRPGQTEAEAFAESFEQVDAAEQTGLDVMWLAELHAAPERSVLAAPMTIAAAMFGLRPAPASVRKVSSRSSPNCRRPYGCGNAITPRMFIATASAAAFERSSTGMTTT